MSSLSCSAPSGAPRRPLRTLLATLLLASAACGGGDGGSGGPTPPPTPTPGTLTVALASSSGSVVAGSQVTVDVTITRGGSFSGAVTLAAEGAPGGVSTAFSASTLAAGATSAGLTIQVAASVAAGTYPLTVRASGTGVTAATATYTLTVTAAPTPTFTLTASPTTIELLPGQQALSTLTLTRAGGFTGPIALAAEGVPANVTATFAATPVTGASTTLTLAAAAAAAPGTYPITVRATGTGVDTRTVTVTLTVASAPSLAVSVAPGMASVAQGQSSAPLTVTLTRVGGLTGDATLTLEGAPAGVTASFTPNPVTGSSAQLVLAVSGGAAPGTYPMLVRGRVGTTTGITEVSLTITAGTTPNFSMALVPEVGTVTAGGGVDVTVNLARTGGFTGAVSLVTSALPTGVTATFTPQSVTGTSTQLRLQTNPVTPAGTYQIVVRGTGAGVGDREVTFSLTVQSGGGGGGGNVVWQFCDDDRFPLWFGYRDGESGAWTRVLPGANQTYSFNIGSAVGSVTYVLQEVGGPFDVVTFTYARTELQALGQSECTTNPARKTLNGTVAGLTAGQTAQIAIGTGSATAVTNGPFVVNDVNDGLTDLLAARSVFDLATFSTVPDRFLLRRNLNVPNNGTLAPLDFDGAEAFAPATASYTFANASADQLAVVSGFGTANGSVSFFTFGALLGGGTTRTVYGVPSGRTQAGDLHYIFATSVAGTTDSRSIGQYNRELTDRTLTFGPLLSAPTLTSLATSPYRRLRAVGSWVADYDQGVGITFQQNDGGGRSWTVNTSRDVATGATWSLEIPDLSAVAGFNTTWGLQAGLATTWALSASKVENAPIGPAVENFRFRAASKTGNVP